MKGIGASQIKSGSACLMIKKVIYVFRMFDLILQGYPGIVSMRFLK
jgi:hypothetical protein